MLIADSTARALENVAARQRELLGALPAENAEFDEHGGQIACAPPPDTYFITQDENGRRMFLRADNLYFNGGNLTDGNGRPVLGYRTPGGVPQLLQAHPVDVSLGLAQAGHISADGTVSYERSTIDPASGDRRLQYVSIGRIAVARFPAGTRLAQSDTSYVSAPAGVVPHLGAPGDGTFSPLQPPVQFSHERELDSGLQRLQEAYLALDALRAAGEAQGGVQKTAMDLLK